MIDQDHHNIEQRVLVLPATGRDYELTEEILLRAGIPCFRCSDVDELIVELTRGAGAVLIVEERLASPQDNAILGHLADQPSWSDLPLLVLARNGADSASVAAAMHAYGNVTVLERPLRIAALVSALRSALRARARQYEVRADAAALQAAKDELEERVRDRTQELERSNRLLEEKMRQTQAAEDRAYELLRELVRAQESERARIARDLHDELGQQITSIRLHLRQLEEVLAADSETRELLDHTQHQAEAIDTHVSFLAWKIRPTTIQEHGLAQALAGYIREWSRNFSIHADFRSSGQADKSLLPEIEVNIYRIAQEALNNIAKYAAESTVDVLLTIGEKEASLIVEDTGPGFDTEALRDNRSDGGLGLSGIRERAALLGGSVEIESRIGTGTTLYVRIPARFVEATIS